jgi:mRNA interferase MazF
MSILNHPKKGSILRCDFEPGFISPEMVKRRPVIVISPAIENHRPGLCTVVALSTTAPYRIMPYHAQITLSSPLPKPYDQETTLWVKGDMVNTVGFHRLNLLRFEKKQNGTRSYYLSTLSNDQLKTVQSCILHGIGLSHLTKHL